MERRTKILHAAILTAAFVQILLVVLTFIYPHQRFGFLCDILSLGNLNWTDNLKNILTSTDWQIITATYAQIVFIVLLIVLPAAYKFRNQLSRLIFRELWSLLIISLIIGVLFGFTNRVGHSPDSRRARDIGQMRLALELYFDYQKSYPKVNSWEDLRKELTAQNCMNTYCIAAVPDDYCFKTVPEHQYAYRSSPDGQKYVLKSIFGDRNNPALRNDIDGEMLGLRCVSYSN